MEIHNKLRTSINRNGGMSKNLVSRIDLQKTPPSSSFDCEKAGRVDAAFQELSFGTIVGFGEK